MDKVEAWPPVDAKGVALCKVAGLNPCPEGPDTCPTLYCDCAKMTGCKWCVHPAASHVLRRC